MSTRDVVRPLTTVAAMAGFFAGAGFGTPSLAANAPMMGSGTIDPAAFISKWDRSGKGMLSLSTIDDAAAVKFERLDTAHAGRLTASALSSILTQSEFDMANPDHDSTIGIDEWLDLVKHRFLRANTDQDGTLDAAELRSPRGQALLKLID